MLLHDVDFMDIFYFRKKDFNFQNFSKMLSLYSKGRSPKPEGWDQIHGSSNVLLRNDP